MKLNVQGREEGSSESGARVASRKRSRFAMFDFSVLLVGCDVRLMMTQ